MTRTRLLSRQDPLLVRMPATRSGAYRTLGIVAGVLGLGLLAAGLYLTPRPAVLALAALGLGLPAVLLLWNRPEFGLLALVFMTSSFLPANLVDVRLPIGGGLDLRDLLLIGLFGLIAFRELTRGTLTIPWWPVGGLLLLFLMLAVFSAFYAIAIRNTESHWALNDLRILSMYSTFFIALWAIKSTKQFRTLLIGLFIIADLTTLVIYLQQLAGADQPLLQAMTSLRDWRVYAEPGGAVRVVPAGHVLMHYMWLIALGMLLLGRLDRRLRAFTLAQLVFIGGGHVLAYTRAQWIAMGFGIGLIAVMAWPRYRDRLAAATVVGISVVLILASVASSGIFTKAFDTPFLAGIGERIASLFTPAQTAESASLQWRAFETEKALQAVQKQPLTGVGLGSRYRDVTSFQGEASGWWTRGSLAADDISRFTRYVHNSYLSITVKMGIPGVALFLWFYLAALLAGFRAARHMPDSNRRGVLVGTLLGATGLLVWSYFHPHFIKAESTPVIGLMLGLIGSQVPRNEQG